jgi:hypothetical protein
MRLLGLAASSLFIFALPCSCAPLSATELPGATDAGGDSGSKGRDGGASSSSGGSGGGLDAAQCAPGDVTTYQPVYHPAAVNPGACTDMQTVADIYAACFGDKKDAGLCQKKQQDAATAACVSCIVTPDTSKNYGPLIEHGGFVSANVGGCIQLALNIAPTLGQPECQDAAASELVCAQAVQALDGCEVAACSANCSVTGTNASLTSYEGCANAADQGGCSSFAQAATCEWPDSGGGGCGLPHYCTALGFQDFFFGAVPLFCLPAPPPVDAGAPLDSGYPDAGAAPDASGD